MRTLGLVTVFLGLLLLVFVVVESDRVEEVTSSSTYAAPMFAENEMKSVSVELPSGMSREGLVEKIGKELSFDEKKRTQLYHTLQAMQWDRFNEVLLEYLKEAHDFTQHQREILATHSTDYLDRGSDVLESLYVPGEYVFQPDESIVELARHFLDRIPTSTTAFVEEHIDAEAVSELLEYVRGEYELLPDLVPLPPQDVTIVDEPNRRLLTFTTVYYNKGDGDLELQGDPETIGTLGDFDREVNQRIYRSDGSYRERPAGNFTWHHEHVHYHFVDFIAYELEGIDNEVEIKDSTLLEKSTFCIRDVSRVHLDGVTASTSAKFRVCGRERQGISVGWGDAYFNTYPDQDLDITELSSGMYRLTFIANPEDRFLEVTKENNVASADILYNKEDGSVRVIDTIPSELPEFEHIHVEQEF